MSRRQIRASLLTMTTLMSSSCSSKGESTGNFLPPLPSRVSLVTPVETWRGMRSESPSRRSPSSRVTFSTFPEASSTRPSPTRISTACTPPSPQCNAGPTVTTSPRRSLRPSRSSSRMISASERHCPSTCLISWERSTATTKTREGPSLRRRSRVSSPSCSNTSLMMLPLIKWPSTFSTTLCPPTSSTRLSPAPSTPSPRQPPPPPPRRPRESPSTKETPLSLLTLLMQSTCFRGSVSSRLRRHASC
mmetsp:Transcript_17253/g.28557  ORF Transcript_17253/g.28557 Transcript_17253/m.28557 type:complete len:247 (-) Transcript_17253:203-943(-)